MGGAISLKTPEPEQINRVVPHRGVPVVDVHPLIIHDEEVADLVPVSEGDEQQRPPGELERPPPGGVPPRLVVLPVLLDRRRDDADEEQEVDEEVVDLVEHV